MSTEYYPDDVPEEYEDEPEDFRDLPDEEMFEEDYIA